MAYRKSLSSIEKWLVVGVLFLLSYSAWARGGTVMPLQLLLPWLAFFLMAGLFFGAWWYRNQPESSLYGWQLLVKLLKDPVLQLGSIFMLLLLVQWWNAGRTYIFDIANNCGTYTPPHFAFLPSAIVKEDAAEMLRWFFPAWVILLVVRSGLITSRGMKYILLGITVNASVLAVFGILQYVTGTNALFWIIPLDCPFFASFGYANHAAAFFVLLLSLALGFLANICFRSYKKRKFSKRIIGFIIMCILLLAAANLSLGVAGIIFSWSLVGFAVIYAVGYVWQDIRPSVRINLIVACVGVLCIGYFVTSGLGKDLLTFSFSQVKKKTAAKEISSRFPQVQTAISIWQDNKLCGVGGWGYRYFIQNYADDDTWELLYSSGHANVHNDPVQFLTEFGLAGFLMMTGIIIYLLIPIGKQGLFVIYKPRVLYPLLGLGITVIHSLLDLPFRCPAILYHWLVVLVAIPYLGERKERKYDR